MAAGHRGNAQNSGPPFFLYGLYRDPLLQYRD
jgi:hypothetical protein